MIQPIGQFRVEPRPAQAIALPGRIIAELNRQLGEWRWFVARKGAVECRDLAIENSVRLSVENQMVPGQQQHMIVVRALDQLGADQGPVSEIVALPPFFASDALNRLL